MTSEVVEAVSFGFMTDEEVKKISVVKISNPNLLDTLDKPIPGGLYDPSMGSLDEHSVCKSCGLRPFHCPGHCGHIDLVSPAYNPLLFTALSNLLNRVCFHCFQFRSSGKEVENCISQLELIRKGDIIGARKLRSAQSILGHKKMEFSVPDNTVDHEDSQGSHTSHSTVHSDVENPCEDNNTLAHWDSSLLSEAISVLDEFLKRKMNKCSNCDFKCPKINKPTFGWFHMDGYIRNQHRSNIIRSSSRMDVTISGEGETTNADVLSGKDDSGPAEANSYPITSYSPKKRNKKDVKRQKKLKPGLEDQYTFFQGPLLPSEVRDILKRLWENETTLCAYINDIQQHKCKLSGERKGYSMFFLDTVLVPPIKFRPPAFGGDSESMMQHPQTFLLVKVIEANVALGNVIVNNAERSKILRHMLDLQQSINVLYDSRSASGSRKDDASGICQYLEKKEGIFRQKMMGKRVNFACRSVISPDPYLSVNEIGIPPYFALKLTYPERVTPWNAAKLRNAVINGPDVHPGATTYVDSVSAVKLPASKKMRIAISRKLPSSRGIQSGKNSELDFEAKIVYRHLQDGDIVLVNRQPTLHKPSIMAHVVRVLKGEKTLRMHYANCSSYNADFDGDEINVHFPQDEISRAEAYNIVNANEQYIVPTRGDTVRGLIQDHIVGAVLLTMKNTFFTRGQFSQLLYGSGIFTSGLPNTFSGKVALIDTEGQVESVLPTIWKPEPLWTGKQVITALLNHITQGRAPCTVENEGKLPKNYFTGDSTMKVEEDEDLNAEHKFLVWKNELVRGVIDKAQFGKFGLVHTVQEFYGSNSAGNLLSALSRLFTIFLQVHGFTCGLDDLMILPKIDAKRKDKLEREDVGEEVHCEFVKFKPGQIGPEQLQLEIEKVISRERESATASLDMKMKNRLINKLSGEGSEILKNLLTEGLLKAFPKNCVSVMTTTGAKGSTVNFQQISAYLGQQELEGKRVPRMVSGKTLPSFPPWDYTSRAGGFITDRFLTGLRPQEYYFHCMAGREGLVDTAVKTSRSGYLQRCLIKNLESLKVCYDLTVRDADGSIVQFQYGEDGVDVHQTSFLENFKALEANRETICQKLQDQREFNDYIDKIPEKLKNKARDFVSSTYKLHKKGAGKKMERQSNKKMKKEQEKFVELVKQKYLSSLAPSGEPVGIIAAQSIGEPSTQMTLNTFHLAGRGEMNVTLGIPRLQEILMTASDVIKTPILTCPFSDWRSKNDVVSLISRVRKVRVADLIESMSVQVLNHHNKVARIYKLIIKLKEAEFVPLADVHETLKSTFLRALEDAIESNVVFLNKIVGIKNVASSSRSQASSYGEDGDEDESNMATREADGEDEDHDDDMGDDLGADAQRRKQQATDEVDYDDGSENEDHEKGESDGEGNVGNEGKCEEKEESDEEREGAFDASGEDRVMAEAKSRAVKGNASFFDWGDKPVIMTSEKKECRAITMEIDGLSYMVEFRFTTEPHVLLAQIAQKAAKKVFITRTGKVSQCKVVEYNPDEKTVRWDDNLKSFKPPAADENTSYWAVKASGDNFLSFWEQMHEHLDLSRLYSNNVHAMLNTYGVEAARATLIEEVQQVFNIYSVKIDPRHLSLIADYMTHTGGYRPMSRHGGISESLSPFLKMSFETATKFVVEAASHGLVDNLETPSSRLCLGLPVKVGTGCFDLMQKLDV